MGRPQSLLIFSIGPVQSFIASARKIEELWSGSYLLSYLAEKAMSFMFEQAATCGGACEMIYPNVTKEELNANKEEGIEIASLPNRFVCRLEEIDQEQTANLAQKTAQQVQQAMEEVCLKGFDRVFKYADFPASEDMVALIKQQVAQTLEIFWAVEAFTGDTHYKKDRDRLEQRLAAIKNDRWFAPMTQDGLVCTVCGEREALCAYPFEPDISVGRIRHLLSQTWTQRDPAYKPRSSVQDAEIYEGRIRDDEYLCGICLGKRTAREYFKVERQNAQAFGRFESSKEYSDGTGYYAILMMDGDNMGAWFTERKGSLDNKTDLAYHQQISRQLAVFSKKTVPGIVKEHGGRLIYAGGDDVLAFAPLNQVLDLAKALRDAFGSEKGGLDKEATASMGVIIAHVKAPLQLLLRDLRQLEKMAKSYVHPETKQEKDALAIQLATHSGEKRQAVIPWRIDSAKGAAEHESMVELYKNIIQHLNQHLSPTFLYAFGEAILPLLSAKQLQGEKLQLFPSEPDKDRELVEIELRRLITRAKKPDSGVLDIQALAKQMATVHAAMPSTLSFVNLLEIATFFRRKERGKGHEDVASTG